MLLWLFRYRERNRKRWRKYHRRDNRVYEISRFLALLGEKFKKDEYSLVNGGYPLLYWQKTFDADDVNEVVEKINDIGDVTADSGVKINEARNAYDNLDDDLKPYVSNLDVLLNAEKKLSEIISLKEAKKTALEQLESYKDASDTHSIERHLTRLSKKVWLI